MLKARAAVLSVVFAFTAVALAGCGGDRWCEQDATDTRVADRFCEQGTSGYEWETDKKSKKSKKKKKKKRSMGQIHIARSL